MPEVRGHMRRNGLFRRSSWVRAHYRRPSRSSRNWWLAPAVATAVVLLILWLLLER
jgi:hypothetical protein